MKEFILYRNIVYPHKDENQVEIPIDGLPRKENGIYGKRVYDGKPYPHGGFMCAECDYKLREVEERTT